MNLLGAKLYDPAVAVSKSTASLLAMTAFDTTNLRVAITVPAHGMIYVRVMGGAVTGATTVPTLFLGVMNGSTVLARITPQDFPGTMNAATQSCPLYAEFVITGLTPGAMNLDLAYGVEVVVASTNIKYGGPNDTTTNNAWGGISFQVWDPQPMTANSTLAVDSNGRVDVSKVAGTTQTAGDLKASLNTLQTDTDDIQTRLPAALVSGRMDASVGAMAANVLTASAIAADAITDAKVASDVTIASVTGAVGSVTAAVSVTGDLSATMKTSVTTAATAATPTVAAVTGNVGGNVVGSVGSVTGLTASDVGAIKLKTDNLPSDPADESLIIAATDAVMARLGAPAGASMSADMAAVKTDTAAIKTATDSLDFSVAGQVSANITHINGVLVNGDGAGTPWGP